MNKLESFFQGKYFLHSWSPQISSVFSASWKLIYRFQSHIVKYSQRLICAVPNNLTLQKAVDMVHAWQSGPAGFRFTFSPGAFGFLLITGRLVVFAKYYLNLSGCYWNWVRIETLSQSKINFMSHQKETDVCFHLFVSEILFDGKRIKTVLKLVW